MTLKDHREHLKVINSYEYNFNDTFTQLQSYVIICNLFSWVWYAILLKICVILTNLTFLNLRTLAFINNKLHVLNLMDNSNVALILFCMIIHQCFNTVNLIILALNKAYKTLENEEGYKRCREIIDEAKIRVEDMVLTVISLSLIFD